MIIQYTVRKKGSEETTYYSAKTDNLKIEEKRIGGEGKPNHPYVHEVTLTNSSDSPWEGVFHAELVQKKNNPRFYMPAFLYGLNRGDTPIEGVREYPRLRDKKERPGSPYWMVRGDKLSHPVVLIHDMDRIYGLHASPYWILEDGKKLDKIGERENFYQYAGYSCNMNRQEADEMDACSIGYTLGYENAPWSFVESKDVREREELNKNCFRIEARETVKFSLYLYDFKGQKPTDMHLVIRDVYNFYHEKPRHQSSISQAVMDIATSISQEAWLPEKNGYSLFVFNQPGSDKKTYAEMGSLSWTNGLSVAVPMLMSGVRLDNDKMKEQALKFINNLIKNCMNSSSGLPFDAYSEDGSWSTNGWWFDSMNQPGHTGYIVGQALYYLMKAYEFMKINCGVTQNEWIDFVKPVLDKIEKQKNSDMEYPYVFSETTGAGIEYDSLGSSWCLAAVASYMWVTKDTTYLEGAIKSEQHYYDAYVAKVEGYGGPLDISKGIDSEGVLAYIRAVKYLHQITGDKKYIIHLKDAIEYELSFKFCYNSPVSVPPLDKINWSSCGGSVTSVVNPHIHPMSSTIVDEIMYLVKQTNDTYFESRLNDVLRWGCQTYNSYDGEFDYGKKGWMSERFCYSESLLKETYPDGRTASTWFAMMPWAGASIIEGMTGDAWTRLYD